MPLYKFFLLHDGEPVEDVERHLGDDLEALEGAWALCRDHVVEVYEEIRPVARIQQEDEPMNARHPAAWSLRMRAYVLLPLFGQTQLWSRVS